jgi:hypothetical protein
MMRSNAATHPLCRHRMWRRAEHHRGVRSRRRKLVGALVRGPTAMGYHRRVDRTGLRGRKAGPWVVGLARRRFYQVIIAEAVAS